MTGKSGIIIDGTMHEVEVLLTRRILANSPKAAIEMARMQGFNPKVDDVDYRVRMEGSDKLKDDALEIMRRDYVDSFIGLDKKRAEAEAADDPDLALLIAQKMEGVQKRLQVIDTALGRF